MTRQDLVALAARALMIGGGTAFGLWQESVRRQARAFFDLWALTVLIPRQGGQARSGSLKLKSLSCRP